MEIDDAKALYTYQKQIYRRSYFDSPLEKAPLRQKSLEV